MPTKTLTHKFVTSTIKVKTRTAYFDSKVTGLALRVTPAGSKSYAFVYRLGGREHGLKWLTMGDELTLDKARDKAREYRRAVDDGRDPAAELAAAKLPPPPPEPVAPVMTVALFSKVFIAFQKGTKKTWYDDELKLRKYILPAWGELPLRSITRTHVHELIDAAVAGGLKQGATQLQAVISRMFTIALDRSLIDAHPVARMIKRFKPKARTRVLTDEEIRAVRTKLDAHPGEAADATWLRLVLGQRAEETAGMLWSELDLEARTWFLDGKRTKNGREHLLFLPATALAMIKRRREAVTDDAETRVFPNLIAADDDTADGRSWGTRSVAAIAQSFPDFEWRDLRRTFATRLAELSIGQDTIGRLLNHAKYGVTGKHYNKYEYLPEKRHALEVWDRELGRVIRNEPKKKGRVLAMSKRA